MSYTRLLDSDEDEKYPLQRDNEMKPLLKPVVNPHHKRSLFDRIPADALSHAALFLNHKDLASAATSSEANHSVFNLKSAADTGVKENHPELTKALATLNEQPKMLSKLLAEKDEKKLTDLLLSGYFQQISSFTHFENNDLFKYACENQMLQLICIMLDKNMITLDKKATCDAVVQVLVNAIQTLDVTKTRMLAKHLSKWLSNEIRDYSSYLSKVLWDALDLNKPEQQQKRLQIAFILQNNQFIDRSEYTAKLCECAYKYPSLPLDSNEDVYQWKQMLAKNFRTSLCSVLYSLVIINQFMQVEKQSCCCFWKRPRGEEAIQNFKQTISNIQTSNPRTMRDLLDADTAILDAINTCWKSINDDRATVSIAEFKKKILCNLNDLINEPLTHQNIQQMAVFNYGSHLQQRNTLKKLIDMYPVDDKKEHSESIPNRGLIFY